MRVVVDIVILLDLMVIVLVQFGNPIYPDLQVVHLLPIMLVLQIQPLFETQDARIDPLILQSHVSFMDAS